MHEIKLLQLRKNLCITFGFIGLVIVLLYLFSVLFNQRNLGGEVSVIGLILLIDMGYLYYSFRKFFFKYDKDQISRYFPGMNEAKKYTFENDGPIEIKKDWKGIQIIEGNKKIDISTDGLWKSDRDMIFKALKKHYSL